MFETSYYAEVEKIARVLTDTQALEVEDRRKRLKGYEDALKPWAGPKSVGKGALAGGASGVGLYGINAIKDALGTNVNTQVLDTVVGDFVRGLPVFDMPKELPSQEVGAHLRRMSKSHVSKYLDGIGHTLGSASVDPKHVGAPIRDAIASAPPALPQETYRELVRQAVEEKGKKGSSKLTDQIYRAQVLRSLRSSLGKGLAGTALVGGLAGGAMALRSHLKAKAEARGFYKAKGGRR